MRIVGGDLRGMTLAALGRGDPAAALRPTSDKVRESLFNILQHGTAGDPVPEARVLDLFAGTGALGLEALSRGGRSAVFVDSGSVAQACIRDNIARARMGDRTRVIGRDARKIGAADAACDLVFLDPPYGRDLGRPALIAAVAGGWIAPNAVVIWEEAAEMPPPPGFATLDTRRWGTTTVTILQADP